MGNDLGNIIIHVRDPKETIVKTKLSKADMTARNKKIFEIRKNGANQNEMVEKFGGVFDIWHKDYRFVLLIKAKKIIGDSHAAEDIVQNTFVSAWKSIGRFDDRCKPLPWLESILKRRTIDYIRKNFGSNGVKKHSSIENKEPMYHPNNIDKDIPRDLQVAIDNLQKDIRKTFLMIALDGNTHQEIANKLNVPIGTVLSRVSRAKSRIKKHLQKFD